MGWYVRPEELLRRLGISRPRDIDIEAIAQSVYATIDYRPLAGCAGRIIGYGDRAILTIDNTSPRGRHP